MFFAPAIRTRTAYVPAHRAFDRSFERFVADTVFSPALRGVNVTQDEQAWTVTLDVPGVSREQLTVDIEDTVVRIGTKEDAKRPFKAAYELPEAIDADATQATLQDGVLTLVLGKKKPVSTARTIEVR